LLGIHDVSVLSVHYRLRGGVCIAQNASGRKRPVSNYRSCHVRYLRVFKNLCPHGFWKFLLLLQHPTAAPRANRDEKYHYSKKDEQETSPRSMIRPPCWNRLVDYNAELVQSIWEDCISLDVPLDDPSESNRPPEATASEECYDFESTAEVDDAVKDLLSIVATQTMTSDPYFDIHNIRINRGLNYDWSQRVKVSRQRRSDPNRKSVIYHGNETHPIFILLFPLFTKQLENA